jgi:hypothetical protein
LDGPQPIIVMEYCSGGVFFLLFQTLFIYWETLKNEIDEMIK